MRMREPGVVGLPRNSGLPPGQQAGLTRPLPAGPPWLCAGTFATGLPSPRGGRRAEARLPFTLWSGASADSQGCGHTGSLLKTPDYRGPAAP